MSKMEATPEVESEVEWASEKKSSLYNWAFRTGKILLERFEELYGTDKAEKRMYTHILTLRSEELPSRFRRQLVNLIVEAKLEDVSFPLEIREERSWSIDEYYRYSTAILAGLHDALRVFGNKNGGKRKGGDQDA